MKQQTILKIRIKPYLLTMIFCVFGINVWAQQKEISGTVTSTDDGLPIPGVSVIVEGTTRGTTTDFDGNYMIEAEATENLSFSYIGFETKTVAVGNQNEINISLEVSTAELDEIVVVGYGTQRKKVSTAATSMVESDDLILPLKS